jgi:pilus assembly protein CpaF
MIFRKIFGQEDSLKSGTEGKKQLGLLPINDRMACLDDLRRQAHSILLSRVGDAFEQAPLNDKQMSAEIETCLGLAEEKHAVALRPNERRYITRILYNEIKGLGPLSDLMSDEGITDIMVNSPQEIWIERGGRLVLSDKRFDDEHHLLRVLHRLVSIAGKQIDSGSPFVDARMQDGSRLHAVIPPLSTRGAVISIRKFGRQTIDGNSMVEQEAMSPAMLSFLSHAVKARKNIIIAGGTGAGKTTMLNMLAAYIPADERIVVVEETAELNIAHPHVVNLESRSANMEGLGNISLRDLIRLSLRMRADRIIVGEARGAEVLDMLQAMNTGHDGSLTTVHANSAADVLLRLETLALLNAASVPGQAVHNMIAAAVDVIVHLARFKDGHRRVTSICGVVRRDGHLVTQELFHYGDRNKSPMHETKTATAIDNKA